MNYVRSTEKSNKQLHGLADCSLVSGFTKDVLAAFRKGKREICMYGLDLYEMLDRNIPFGEVVLRKARRAAENGSLFVRVRDLGF